MSEIVVDPFLKLPEELSGSVLMDWLPIRALMVIDSAYCSTSKRPLLLDSVFGSSVCLYRMVPPKCIANDFTKWVFLRGIRRNELVLNNETGMRLFEEYAIKTGEHVQRVKLEDVDDLEVNASEIISVIALHCRSLVSLIINKCFISESIIDVLFYCSGLRELRIGNCDEALQSTLDLGNLRDHTYSHLSSVLLHCADSMWLAEAVLQLNDPASLVQLSVRCDDIPVMHMLQQQLPQAVHLCSLGLPRSRALSDYFLMEILADCSSVQHLDISGCMELTDISGAALAQQLVHLSTLNISFCLFTNELLVALAEHRRATLTGLYAHSCGKLTGEGLNQFFQDCPNLRTFGFSCCDLYAPGLDFAVMNALTSLVVDEILPEDEQEVFEFVCEHCTQLQHLRLCFEEGYESFDFMLFGEENLPDLQSLVVYYPVTRYQHVHPTAPTDIMTEALNWFDQQAAQLANTHPEGGPAADSDAEDENHAAIEPAPNDLDLNDAANLPGNNHPSEGVTASAENAADHLLPDPNPTNDNSVINTLNVISPHVHGHSTPTTKNSNTIKLEVADVTTQRMRALQVARPMLVVKHGREAFEYSLLDLEV